MNQFLTKYDAEIEVIGPVFIGNGKEITKKEYLFFDNFQKIGVLDMPRFYSFLRRKGLQKKYEDFMMNNSGTDLRRWIRDNGLRAADVKPYMKYSIDVGDVDELGGKPKAVMEFIKDPYGKPYIPGSSIKGMLRTILLAYNIAADNKKYKNNTQQLLENIEYKAERKKYLKNDAKNLESSAFYSLNRPDTKQNDAVNDILSGLIISDSDYLNVDDLVLCQKIERKPDGNEKGLPLLRECIKPGTKIKFTVTINNNLNNIRKQDILNAVENFSDCYNKYFLSNFIGMDRVMDNTVFLGGGSGFVSKTVIYPLLGKEPGIDAAVKIFKNTHVPKEHKHDKDKAMHVSPHILKVTYIEGNVKQFGECRLKIV